MRRPRDKGDGTRVYDAALVYAGRKLQYAWGEEIPTPEALSSPAYLDGLHGISVVLHHPTTNLGHVVAGQAPKNGPGRRIGTVVGARFDASEGEKGAVIVELAVHEPGDQREVERLKSVSEAYHADTVPLGHRVAAQVARHPNTIAITGTPRAEGGHIRTDESKEPDMAAETKQFDPETALRMIGEADARTATEKTRADKAEAELVKARADAKTAEDKAKVDDKARADAQEIEVNRLAEERAGKLVKLQSRADALKVKIPDDVVGLKARTAYVAKQLNCPDGMDAEAFIAGVETRADAKGKSSADRFVASAKTEGARSDNDDAAWPV